MRSDWEAYQRRERRKELLRAGCAWGLLLAAGTLFAGILWLAFLGFWVVFG